MTKAQAKMIVYTSSVDDLNPQQLVGFWVGWPNPPTPQTHLKILRNSYVVWLARVSADDGQVVGFINAVSDGVQAAYIPNLEVLPAYQGCGIGSELARRMLDSLKHLYMIDLICDAHLQPFYARLGMRPYSGMIQRNYARQAAD